MAQNLDVVINRIGYQIVEKIKREDKNKTKYKNEIDKVLGILSNDGVYAYYVYVKSKKLEIIFLDELKGLMEEFFGYNKAEASGTDKYEYFFAELSNNLSDLLFFRDILEKILIYARYHAKTIGDNNE